MAMGLPAAQGIEWPVQGGPSLSTREPATVLGRLLGPAPQTTVLPSCPRPPSSLRVCMEKGWGRRCLWAEPMGRVTAVSAPSSGARGLSSAFLKPTS